MRVWASTSKTQGERKLPLFAFCASAVLLAQFALAAEQNPSRPAGYAGSDACQVCHEDVVKAFAKNPHHVVETGGKPKWKGMACESCHGPGAKHAESASAADISNPSKLPAAATDRTCLKCHLNEPTHAGRIRGSHAKDDVSCTSCHAVHKGPELLRPAKASAINEQCAKCHTSVWAQFQRPYKHRLPEGAMSCTDCHNPHGGFLRRSIRTVAENEPGCFRCHSDKRGPFTFEHAPVRLEGCSTCHQPHGSANPRMLTRREVRFLCLECHSNIGVTSALGGNPPAFHDLRSARYQNCTICHTKIHGSYVDASLER